MISTPFSCNTPSCVCRVFVSVSKPLVQQDPGVRKTKETQSRNPIPGHMPLRNVVHWRIFSLVASSFLASSSLCYSQQRLYLLICFSPNHWTDGGFIREQFSWSGQNNGALIRVPPAATAGQRFLWIPNMEQLPLSWSACGMSYTQSIFMQPQLSERKRCWGHCLQRPKLLGWLAWESLSSRPGLCLPSTCNLWIAQVWKVFRKASNFSLKGKKKKEGKRKRKRQG